MWKSVLTFSFLCPQVTKIGCILGLVVSSALMLHTSAPTLHSVSSRYGKWTLTLHEISHKSKEKSCICESKFFWILQDGDKDWLETSVNSKEKLTCKQTYSSWNNYIYLYLHLSTCAVVFSTIPKTK